MKYFFLLIPLIISYLLIWGGVFQGLIPAEDTKFLYPFPILLWATGSIIFYTGSQVSERMKLKAYTLGSIIRLFLSICYFGVYVFLTGEARNPIVLGIFGILFLLFKTFELIVQKYFSEKKV